MGRKRIRLAALLLAVLFLAGCWDRIEVEDQSYIITLGVDRAPSGKLLVTADVIAPQQGGTGSPGATGGNLASELLTAEAETINQALYILNGGLTRRLDLRHVRGLFLGEDLSREGVEQIVMELHRHPHSRASALMMQARGRAYDHMAAFAPMTAGNPAKNIEGLLLQGKYLHMAPPVRKHSFMTRLAAPGTDPFLPSVGINPWIRRGPQEPRPGEESATAGELPRGGGNPVEFVGTAIFRGDRLAGYISVDETQMLLALRGEMGKAYVTLPDPTTAGQPVTMRFHQENFPKLEPSFRNRAPHMRVRLTFEGEVLAVPGGTNYVPPAARQRLEEAAARYAEETAAGLVAKLKEWKADPVGFGLLFRGAFPTWQAWLAYDWPRHVGEMEVDVQAKMRIRRYGLYTGPDRVKGGNAP